MPHWLLSHARRACPAVPARTLGALRPSGGRPARTRVRALALAAVCLMAAGRADAAATVSMTITPTSISFPDANPSTTPVVTANSTVLIWVRVGGGSASDPWSVRALANGDLVSGANTIPIDSISWTTTKGTGNCNNTCTGHAGTLSKTTARLIVDGRGNTGGDGTYWTQAYSKTNPWSHAAGSFSQTVTITAASP
jgi:hypothetical protein